MSLVSICFCYNVLNEKGRVGLSLFCEQVSHSWQNTKLVNNPPPNDIYFLMDMSRCEKLFLLFHSPFRLSRVSWGFQQDAATHTHLAQFWHGSCCPLNTNFSNNLLIFQRIAVCSGFAKLHYLALETMCVFFRVRTSCTEAALSERELWSCSWNIVSGTKIVLCGMCVGISPFTSLWPWSVPNFIKSSNNTTIVWLNFNSSKCQLKY